MKSIKVLVVDDSLFIRASIPRLIKDEPDIEIIDVAKDGREAVEKVKILRPDVVTLDVIMPVMDGLAALKEIMKVAPTPVVMLSSITRRGARETIAALAAGAVDFIPKPLDVASPGAMSRIKDELIQKIKTAAISRVSAVSPEVTAEHLRRAMQVTSVAAQVVPKLKTTEEYSRKAIVAIGASTGGPSALQIIFSSLPATFPLGIIIVQHISPGFTEALVERLDGLCPIDVKVAEDNEIIKAGTAYFAPPDQHLKVSLFVGNLLVNLDKEPEGQPNRPSVDVTFSSAAEACGSNCCGVILTGMGGDGALGMKKIKEHGGLTIAQNEATSIIFGMARRSIEVGAVDKVLPLSELTAAIVDFAREQTSWAEEAV